jgi:hypothetical protein
VRASTGEVVDIACRLVGSGRPLVLLQLGLDRAGRARGARVDVGWSMGGMVAQALAVRHPGMVRRLVLDAATPPGNPDLVRPSDAWVRVAVKPTYSFEDVVRLFYTQSRASRAAAAASEARIAARRDPVPPVAPASVGAKATTTTPSRSGTRPCCSSRSPAPSGRVPRQRTRLPVPVPSEAHPPRRDLPRLKIVATCAHCFNTLKNEYRQLGGRYEVVHHTQLLNRLVREGRLTPVAPVAPVTEAPAITVMYHDPSYIGRRRRLRPPRELIGALPGVALTEMPRHGNRSFCCGAGGARMWMEERLGTRINNNRTDEALATGAEQVAVACPFCRVMFGDSLTSKQADGSAGEGLEVVDVAQMLLAAVRWGDPAGEPASV